MRRKQIFHQRSQSRAAARSILARAAVEVLECRTLLADVSGFVYEDRNDNGTRDATDPAMPLRTVYVDDNNNGVHDASEDFEYSTFDGSYTIKGLADGTYTLRVMVPVQYRQTEPQPADAGQVVTVAGGVAQSGVSFGLTATVTDGSYVTGNVFEDSNADGLKNNNDQPRSTTKVYGDANGNALLDPGEEYTVARLDGVYKLLLHPGAYTIRAELPSGYRQSVPAPGTGYAANVTPGLASIGMNFGVYATSPLIAFAYNDTNGDGVRAANESYVGGRTFYLDANGNGSLDAGETSAVSTSAGRVQFDLYPGTYTVRQVLPSGWAQTSPAGGAGWVADVESGFRLFAKEFGSQATSGTITGTVFNDADGDGARDAGEAALPGLLVWIDTNNNAVTDAGESSTTTDASGGYAFANLPFGSYTFRVAGPAGYAQTIPVAPKPGTALLSSTFPTTVQNFGFRVPPTGAVTATVFDDNDGDGKFGPGDAARANAVVFIDANVNNVLDATETSATTDANGSVTFAARPPGWVMFRVGVPAGYVATTGSSINGAFTSVVARQTAVVTPFGVVARSRVTAVTGTTFDDLDADGVRDAGEPALVHPTIHAYVDANNNAQFDAGERTPMNIGVVNDYIYQFLLPVGQYTIRQALPAGRRQTSPAANAPRTINVASTGGTVTGMDFGSTTSAAPPPPTTGTIRGTIFQDLDADGVRDPGEPGVAISRWLFLDANGNRTYDDGEPTTYSTTDGTYFFLGVNPGTYMVGQDGSFTTFQTSPTTLAGATVTVAAGGEARVDFGDNPNGNIILGKVFVDTSGNGYHEPAETLLAGRTVYADLNNNNVLDAAEPRIVTESTPAGYNGWQFRMRLPGPGAYVLRQVLPAGWEQTAPAGTGGISMTLGVNEGRVVFFASRPKPTGGYAGTPFSGTPITIGSTGTTTLQVENYDNGAEGVAYHDTDAANVGKSTYRGTTGVDLEPITDGSAGVGIGYAKAGEWLKYSVNVAQAGAYNVGFRVASLKTGGSMHLEVDGVKVGNSITVPDTTAWTTWKTITLGGVQLPTGPHVLTLKFDTNGGIGYVGNFNYLTFTPTTVTPPPPPPPPPTGYTGTPYKGTPAKVNATGSSTIELENFDDGGENVSYHDTDTANLGKTTYRTGGVDVEAITDAGTAGYGLGFAKAGEWLKYTVDVAADGTYALDVRLASLTGGGAFHFEVDGVRVTNNLTVPKTGAWTTYSTLTQSNIALKAGRHVVRLVMDANGGTGYVANFNWMRFTRT